MSPLIDFMDSCQLGGTWSLSRKTTSSIEVITIDFNLALLHTNLNSLSGTVKMVRLLCIRRQILDSLTSLESLEISPERETSKDQEKRPITYWYKETKIPSQTLEWNVFESQESEVVRILECWDAWLDESHEVSHVVAFTGHWSLREVTHWAAFSAKRESSLIVEETLDFFV